MTGFGSATGAVGHLRISVEIRTVNHRFFSPNFKIPYSMGRLETELREKLRLRIRRGHATLLLRTDRDADVGDVIDEERFAGYVDQLRRLSERHGLGKFDAGAVLRLPGVVASSPEDEGEIDASLILQVVDAAVAALDSMRAAEGRRLAEFLFTRLGIFSQAVERIEARAPVRIMEQRHRMRQSVRALMEGIAVDEQRISQEIAILADRLDIAEEIGRLRSHVRAFESALNEQHDEAIGKRLGFILQEMLREVNTIGSKGADMEILSEVVLLKEELERMREQVENIE